MWVVQEYNHTMGECQGRFNEVGAFYNTDCLYRDLGA